MMTSILAGARRYPVVAFFATVFVISWGALVLVVGLGAFVGVREPLAGRVPLMFLAVLAGTSIAGVVMTLVMDGRKGLGRLWRRLGAWRVDTRWYLVALFLAPLVILAVALLLSGFSSSYLPTLFMVDDTGMLLVGGVAGGLMAGVLEEVGWTGFAVPWLRKRFSVVGTGVIVGLLWGAWHYPLFASGDTGGLSRLVLLPVLLFSFLPPFRVLMVWMYEKTGSLLLIVLMHVSLTASIQILQPHDIAGMTAVTYDLVLGGILWLLVAGTIVAERGRTVRLRHGKGAA